MIEPTENGFYGKYGGMFVPDTLMPALRVIVVAFKKLKKSKQFQAEINYYLTQYVGRPTPLFFADATNCLSDNLF